MSGTSSETMCDTASSDTALSETAPSFPFHRLLPELQILVLEAALPDQRVFHVAGQYHYISNDRDENGTGRLRLSEKFSFHVRHPPPAVLSVCRAARYAVLRLGLFLDGAHGAFFVPAVDMLYFDRNERSHIGLPPPVKHPDVAMGGTRIDQSAWDAIQHVGLEWRAFFSRTPRAVPGRTDMGGAWREAVAPLRMRMPNMRSLTYVLPRVRHPGGLAWGREPYGAPRFPPTLRPLPDETRVPWGDALVLEEMPTATATGSGRRNYPAARVALEELLGGRRSYLVPWVEMRAFVQDSLNEPLAATRVEGKRGRRWRRWRKNVWHDGGGTLPPLGPNGAYMTVVGGGIDEEELKEDWRSVDVRGCWLLREDAEYDEDVTSFWN